MKKIILIASLLIVGISVDAQGRRDKQSAIHAEYGYLPETDNLEAGYSAKLGYTKVFGDKGLMGKAEAFYSDYTVTYTGNQILPYQKYGLNVNLGYSYEGLYPLMVNLWGGGFGGYETVNKGNERDPKYNAKINEQVKGITYGLSGSLELELFLARKLSFLANYTQFYDLKSEFSQSNYGAFGGLRFYIN